MTRRRTHLHNFRGHNDELIYGMCEYLRIKTSYAEAPLTAPDISLALNYFCSLVEPSKSILESLIELRLRCPFPRPHHWFVPDPSYRSLLDYGCKIKLHFNPKVQETHACYRVHF